MKRKYNQRTALAFHFGCDYQDIEWYQPTVFHNVKIFSSGDYYYCALTKGKKPPKGHAGDLEWEERPDNMLNAAGWRIMQVKVA